MPNVTFDGTGSLITVDSGVASLDVGIDLYSDWKEWVRESDNSKYLPAFRAVGGEPLGGGDLLGATFFIQNGWKIRPFEEDYQLTLVGSLVQDPPGNFIVPTTGDFTVLTTNVVPINAKSLNDATITGIDANSTLVLKLLKNRLEMDTGTGANHVLYDDDDITPLLTFDVTDVNTGAIQLPDGVPARRSRGT